MNKHTYSDALQYHAEGRPGKIEVVPTKPHSTQRDLSLAYSPGVALPCLEIKDNPQDVYKYTAKGNLVAVISNGTAVLGLGDIGALAGKPVMEGKGLLFKTFADIDVFDIEVDEKDVEKFICTVRAIAPTFGGINLEDIKAPECFEIETRLKQNLDIPVFHDDQHGTAIITGAALLNALELVGKKIDQIRLVVSGAGAAGVSCTRMFIHLGVNPANIIMFDINGVLHKQRTDLNPFNSFFAIEKEISLAKALEGADMFLGLSAKGVLKPNMLLKMAPNPIVFALANPDPEITYNEAISTRNDLVMATGRSDFPNQVNNVLGFPFIFRGALDVRASAINEEMKIAAVYALANLAKKDVPDSVISAYGKTNIVFGREYIIPKPFDPRLLTTVAPAIAKAAIESGVARKIITDWEAYKLELEKRLGLSNDMIRAIYDKAKRSPKRVVLSEGIKYNMLKAAQMAKNEGIAVPILLGNEQKIRKEIAKYELDLCEIEIIDPRSNKTFKKRKEYARLLYNKRYRKGVMLDEAEELMLHRRYFGTAMVEAGDADVFIAGFSTKYPDSIRPAMELIGTKPDLNHVAGMYLMLTKQGPIFLADTTVNIEPNARTLVDTTLLTAAAVRKFNMEPVIALVSYSNFGSTRTGSPKNAHEAVEILHRDYPDLIVDGEMQVNFALNAEMRMRKFPFSKLGDRDVNTIIFPNLSSGNIGYKLMHEFGATDTLGPILLGINKPIHVAQIESSVRELVNMIALAVADIS